MPIKLLHKSSWNSIWKKRRKFLSTSLNLKNNEYGDFVVVSNKANIFNDSDFSLDKFLTEFAKLRIDSICQLPDKCLIEIVKRLPLKEVLNLRLVSNRFNDIVQVILANKRKGDQKTYQLSLDCRQDCFARDFLWILLPSFFKKSHFLGFFENSNLSNFSKNFNFLILFEN